jgi:transcriptional regulator with GAF, ATPase, and Fis domain
MTSVKDSLPDVLLPRDLDEEGSSRMAGRFGHILSQPDEMVGNSDHIRLIKQCIDRVAPSEATVLITGETGTGKELVAHRIHRKSKRSDRPFIAVNCAAIPDSLLESELFGFEKGAFTGAVSQHEGRFGEADKGTLFLDEIGDLSPAAQAKLLRILEQKVVQPLGSRKVRKIDFRLIAATNRDLERLAAHGDFRQDLFYRISVIHVPIAPLRERREDIGLLADHFLTALGLQYCRPFVIMTAGAKRYLKCRPWIGNARELRNAIERAFFLSNSEQITEEDIAGSFPLFVSRQEGSPTRTSSSFRATANDRLRHHTSNTGYESSPINWSEVSAVDQLRKALEETRWNKSKAAKMLRCSRMTLYRKVVQYELHPLSRSSSINSPVSKKN